MSEEDKALIRRLVEEGYSAEQIDEQAIESHLDDYKLRLLWADRATRLTAEMMHRVGTSGCGSAPGCLRSSG
jgi:hypothetical protein